MKTRRACSIAWAVLVALAVLSVVLEQPLGIALVWLAALPLHLITARATRGATDERLDRPVVYYVAAGAVLAVTVGGALLAAVPGASDISDLFACYLAPIAWLAYRALVARGPWRPIALGAVAQVFSLPFLFLGAIASMGCKCGPYRASPPWTDDASLVACLATQLLAMILVGVAVVAFRPRDGELPEARVAARS